MGEAWAMWECAANHKWVNYTIIVKSAETDEIKYIVWMGSDPSQRKYYCFLSSAWGHNATFAFKELDEFSRKSREQNIKSRSLSTDSNIPWIYRRKQRKNMSHTLKDTQRKENNNVTVLLQNPY